MLILLRNQTLGQRAYEGKKNQAQLSNYVKMLNCAFITIVWVSEIMLQQVILNFLWNCINGS